MSDPNRSIDLRSKDSEVSSSSGLEATKNEDLEDVAADGSNSFEGRVADRIIVEQNCCPKIFSD